MDISRNGNGHIDRIRHAAAEIQRSWEENPRFAGIERRYEAEEVVRLRGSVRVEHSLA
jgi:isocitrate/methylisocitrate lyase